MIKFRNVGLQPWVVIAHRDQLSPTWDPCDMDGQSSTAFLCTLTHAVKTNSYELPMCSCLLASKLIQLSQFGTFMENYPIVDDVSIQNCDFHIQYFQWQTASQPERVVVCDENSKDFDNPQYICISYKLYCILPPNNHHTAGFWNYSSEILLDISLGCATAHPRICCRENCVFLWSTRLCHGVFHMAELCWA